MTLPYFIKQYFFKAGYCADFIISTFLILRILWLPPAVCFAMYYSRQTNLSLFQERVRLQRDLLTVEKAAQETHKQARTLQEQLRTISQELLCLKDKVQTGNSTVTHHICLLL